MGNCFLRRFPNKSTKFYDCSNDNTLKNQPLYEYDVLLQGQPLKKSLGFENNDSDNVSLTYNQHESQDDPRKIRQLRELQPDPPPETTQSEKPQMGEPRSETPQSEKSVLPILNMQEYAIFRERFPTYVDSTNEASSTTDILGINYEPISVTQNYSSINGNIDIDIFTCQRCLTASQEKRNKNLEENENFSENSHTIASATYVFNNSEQLSTSNSEDSVLYKTDETFPADKIETFNHAGGQMYCCDECDDYLDIPAGAISPGKNYEIIQQFPFINRQDENNDSDNVSLTYNQHESQDDPRKIRQLRELQPDPPPETTQSEKPQMGEPRSETPQSEKSVLPILNMQEYAIFRERFPTYVDSTNEASSTTDILGINYEPISVTQNYSSINGNIDIDIFTCQRCLTASQEKRNKNLEENENFSENSHTIASATYVFNNSEQLSTSNSEDSVLYKTDETFPADKIETFNHAGGQMYCCDECDDYLDIPAGAISPGKNYEIIQQFPFINRQDEKECCYRIVCVKEYHERENRAFDRHVRIVTHFASDVDAQYIKVRHSTDKGNYEEVSQLENSEDSNCCTFDVYFTAQNNILTIYTRHFTVFIIEEQRLSSLTNIFSKSSKQRFIDLVVHAYFSIDYEERKVLLHMYIQDIRHKKYEEVKKETDINEAKRENRCYFKETRLTGLPDIIKRSTEFQCLLFLCRSKWKKMLCTETFELEDMSDEEAQFLLINTTATLGKISYNKIKAGDILNTKTNITLVGDFKMKYDETEKAFAPLFIIKTSTPVSQPQENQPQQQSQTTEVSISRLNGDEIKLHKPTITTVTRTRIERRHTYVNLPGQFFYINEEVRNAEETSIFHGLLSDKGLYLMAENIGVEWNHLASVLHVPYSMQQILQQDNPYNIRKQIADMLRWWRDRQTNNNSIVKERLCDALLSIGKTEIAEQLKKELVEGSNENIFISSIPELNSEVFV